MEQFSGTAAHPRKKSTPSLVPCASVHPQSGAGQLFIQERSQHRPWCLVPVSIPRVERDSCSSKKEVNTVLGALRQRPSPEWSGTAAHPRKKSTPSLVPCASVHPQSGAGQLLIQERSQHRPWCLVPVSIPRVERDSCSSKKEVNTVLGALCQCPSPEWSGTAAHPRKKSTPSLVPCASVHPQSGAGQLLIQERSQHRPWCLVPASIPRVERDSCSSKKEVNTILGALCQCPSPEWSGTAAHPRKKSTPSLVPCASVHPQSGAGQLLIQERSQHRPWCLAPVSIPRVERDSCLSKKEAQIEKNF